MSKEIAIMDGSKQIKITMDDVRKLICENATDKEIELFLRIAESSNLNPFKREVYLIKYSDRANIVIGYEIYLKRAELSDKYQGFERGCDYAKVGDKYPTRAWIKIYIKGWAVPLFHSVKWNEYVQTNQAGIPNRMWANKPETMLLKVATCQGLRLAFPNECGGLPYEETEIVNYQEIKPTLNPNLNVEETKPNNISPETELPNEAEKPTPAEKKEAKKQATTENKTEQALSMTELRELAMQHQIPDFIGFVMEVFEVDKFPTHFTPQDLIRLKQQIELE